MNLLHILFETFFLGVLVSSPMGPMGILVVRRTLNKGRTFGLASGLGIATADVLFSVIALFGLSAFNISIDNIWIRLSGGITFIIVGFFMYKTNPVVQVRKQVTGRHYFNYYISAFLLSLTNPVVILFFAASFAALGFTKETLTFFTSFLVILGVFAGAITWWVSITAIISAFRKKIKLRGLFWINKISGIIVLILGIITIISIFTKWNFGM